MDSSFSTASTRTVTTSTSGRCGGFAVPQPGRRLAALVLTVVAVTGCGGGGGSENDEDTASGGSCPAELMLNGTRYTQEKQRGDLAIGPRVGDASFTPCVAEKEAIPAFRVRGVDIATAFAAEMGGQHFLFVSEAVEDPCSLPVVNCD